MDHPVVVDSSSSAEAAAAVLAAWAGLDRGLNLVLLCGEKSLVLCVVVVVAASVAISLLSSESTASGAAAVAATLGLDCGLLNLLQRIASCVSYLDI